MKKLAELGAQNLADKELLAILLRSGNAKKNILKTVSGLLKKAKLTDIANMTIHDLKTIPGIGTAYAASIVAAFELANRVRDQNNMQLTQPEHMLQLVHDIKKRQQEYFVCLYLNARYNLLSKKTISIGTINASLAHPREVFRPAIEMGASYIVIAHNHPSGKTEPSPEDVMLTARMVEVGEIIGIHVLDHIIVADKDWMSFKKREMM
ncbi:MAG: hypothetical protein UZ22_OP11002000019 [Microgenomates bacterium OLB23]|nr:MAG: hypothetical protein UZ22_OP11002000019 [Microgenomates bacterium OLB23]